MTPTEQKILDIIKSDDTVTAKAISLDLGWGGENLGNIYKYLKRLKKKGAIQVVPQRIIVQPYCKAIPPQQD